MRKDSSDYCIDITIIEITMIDIVEHLALRLFHVKH